MTSSAGGTITLLIGAVLTRLSITGAFRRYVRVGMGPWLAVAGVLLVVLGCAALAKAWKSDGDGVESGEEDVHQHHDGGRQHVGWLLLAPVVALLLVAPPALGSFGVDRAAPIDIRSGAPTFLPLSGAGPVPMTLLEFGQRAFDAAGASFRGIPVQLTGFVARADGGDGFRIARYRIGCCAADALPAIVRVTGAPAGTPAVDQWVTVTGTFQPGTADDESPAVVATSVVEIPPPGEPYETW